MSLFANRKYLLIIIVIILVIAVPVTLFLLQQQQDVRQHAASATTLAYSPSTSPTSPLQVHQNDSFSVDMMVNPGANAVSVIRYEITYDSTKLALSAPIYTQNTASFPTTLEGPIYTTGKISGTVSIGSDYTKAIVQPTKVATVRFKALTTTGSTPTQISYAATTQVLSVSGQDQASENVLSSTTPAFVSIGAAISCTGGSGGNAIGGTGITVHGGNGGSTKIATDGSCIPGTNGPNVNASNYCSTKAIALTWPATVTATYYRLLIDGVQVYNGTGLSYSAANYSVGGQHNITLYAGNMTYGDFNPSTGGYFLIASMACITPTPTPFPTPTNTPFPTPTPTRLPTPTPTPKPSPTPTRTPTPTSTPVPTNTPVPTATPIPLATKFAFTVLMHGIGHSGDNANPTAFSLSNQSPIRQQRTLTIEVINIQGATALTKSGLVSYNSTKGNFTGIIDMGTSIVSGSYNVKVKAPQYLKKQAIGIQIISAGQTVQIPSTTLVTGDVNGDNKLNILDYDIIVGCYSDFAPAVSCNGTQNSDSDLTDDGKVNQFDYNLFLRDLSVQNGD